jgi:protease I
LRPHIKRWEQSQRRLLLVGMMLALFPVTMINARPHAGLQPTPLTGGIMLKGKRIGILATDGFEQSELVEPLKQLREKTSAEVKVIAPQAGSIRGVKGKEWGDEVPVDATLDEVSADDFDTLVLPGGVYNPDALRQNEKAIGLIKDMFAAKKPIAAICHGPWLLAEAGLVRGRKVTSYPSIKTDLVNAGGLWVDEEVVVTQALITSRNPGDLPAFIGKIIEETREGKHEDRVTQAA